MNCSARPSVSPRSWHTSSSTGAETSSRCAGNRSTVFVLPGQLGTLIASDDDPTSGPRAQQLGVRSLDSLQSIFVFLLPFQWRFRRGRVKVAHFARARSRLACNRAAAASSTSRFSCSLTRNQSSELKPSRARRPRPAPPVFRRFPLRFLIDSARYGNLTDRAKVGLGSVTPSHSIAR